MCVFVRLFVVPLGTGVAQSADKHIVAVAELAGFGLVASVLLGANYFVFCIHSMCWYVLGFNCKRNAYTQKAPKLKAWRLCDLGDLYSCVATLYLVDDGVPFAVDLGGY